MLNSHSCKVCGLKLDFPPWGEDGQTPSFEICPCCGVEFGYEDATEKAIYIKRNNWLHNGAKWFDPTAKPDNWDLSEQLKNSQK